jgi:hypothetical protein
MRNMKMNGLTRAIGAGLVSLALAGGCASDNYRYHPGHPPRVVREEGERKGENWKHEGGYEYMAKVYFEGKWYNPKSLENARQIQEELTRIEAKKSLEFLEKHGFPRD